MRDAPTRTTWRVLALAVSLLAAPALATADETFDVWRFPPLEGWNRTAREGFVGLTRIDGSDFCLVGIYKSRPGAGAPLEEEIAKEWKDVVEASFTSGAPTPREPLHLRSGVMARSLAAATRDGDGNAFHTVLYVLAPYGRIASVLVTTSSPTSFATYEPTVRAFLDSLRVDVDSIAAELARQPGGVARAGDLVGSWGGTASVGPRRYGDIHTGSTKHQYELRKDGTYSFKRESWGGTFRSDEWHVVEEAGTYAVDANKLTITPKSVSGIVRHREGAVIRKADPPLEPVTYLWRFFLFEGIGETQLVLTPPAETQRDGPFGGNASFRSSYLLSSKYKPEWKAFGK